MLLLGVYGVYFLFSEAFLSREATARGTPREKSTRCRSYKVISSSFTRLHSVPFHSSNFSLSLSLLFPFYQFANNCSTDLGIVVINRSLVGRTNEWNLRGVWRRENSAKKRESERKGRKKNNHPPFFLAFIPFLPTALQPQKTWRNEYAPGHKTRVLCAPRVQSGGETGNQVKREIISHYCDFSPFRLTFVRRRELFSPPGSSFFALVPPIHYAHYRGVRLTRGRDLKFNGGRKNWKWIRWLSWLPAYTARIMQNSVFPFK